MAKTLGTCVTEARAALNEDSAARWTDQDLRQWANEAARDIATRIPWYRKTGTVSAVAGTQEYSLPSDAVGVHAVRYVQTGTSNAYDLEYYHYRNMAQSLGPYLTTSAGTPRLYWTWGYPGSTTFKLNVAPVPSAAGTFTIHYYGVPTDMTTATTGSDSTGVTVPEGYERAVVFYMVYSALMSDGDPRWQDYKSQYESTLASLEEAAIQYGDQAGSLGGPMPYPIYAYMEDW